MLRLVLGLEPTVLRVVQCCVRVVKLRLYAGQLLRVRLVSVPLCLEGVYRLGMS